MKQVRFLIPEVDIICMTSGKCGSSTLNTTFIKNGFKSIKVHNKKDFEHQFGYDGLIDLINMSSINKTLYLIDSYRTPIERKIASFFQNLHRHVPYYKNKSIKELIAIFNNKYIDNIEEYHSINPIMEFYGLEPFDKFDFDKKYVIKKKGNLVFIKILFADLNEWGSILSKIFKREIVLVNDNISKKKTYSSIYEDFKLMYKPKKEYINNILSKDREFKIFNTKKKQEVYIDKHSKSAI